MAQQGNTPELRASCAERLGEARQRIRQLRTLVGFDGFVDEIIDVVDKRQGPDQYQSIETIPQLARRIGNAAGKSTNIELVTKRTKLGGNGPIMANALGHFGLQVEYIGALGYPTMDPIFNAFSKWADVHSIAPAGHTQALEFSDGKVMLTGTVQLNEISWPNLVARYGRDRFQRVFESADGIGFVNWTMIPQMTEIWRAVLKEFCPTHSSERRVLFFDLADPEKRPNDEVSEALELVRGFAKHFDVVIGFNEKEAFEIGDILGLNTGDPTPEGIGALTREIHRSLQVHTVVVHPVTYALAVAHGDPVFVEGPYVARPVITTGAGDHFNAGFCLGRLLNFDERLSLLVGVATSGYYVQHGESPQVDDLIRWLRNWPER